jgi:hypothetical protein
MTNLKNRLLAFALANLLAAAAGSTQAADTAAPGAIARAQRNAYFGDLHLHTSYSFDAYVMLGARITPEEAYHFAKGEPVEYFGKTVRRKWPLDFFAVTDHSESIGVFNALDDPNSDFSRSDIGQRIRKGDNQVFWDIIKLRTEGKPLPGVDEAGAARSAWQREMDAANKNYAPGKFTTFIGYEWTSMPQTKYNLHRNVIFKGDKAPFPFTSVDSIKPEDLWSYMENNRRQGIEALAISHNANASGGLMFDWKDSEGRPIDEAYAQRRVLNEPLTEISQNKGQSETTPELSPNDEFANFEVIEQLLVGSDRSNPHGSYAREAYARGLQIEKTIGVNPFKFGMVGASDIHNGLSTSDENAYGGNTDGTDPTVHVDVPKPLLEMHGSKEGGSTYPLIKTGPGSLTGVWAEENTRDSIYAALRRKESFATSGTRLKFRFFSGWNYDRTTLDRPNWVNVAYERGVSMGGDLPAKPDGVQAPRFLAWAAKDPNGANLDRIQVVKVWLKDGEPQEKVFDVALSNGRKVDPKTGKAPAVGNTVDVKKAIYTNTIGAAQLSKVWEDPEFDSSTPAVYYLRVIEIPTPRWSTINAVKAGTALPDSVPASFQERGWSSPIWFTPKTPDH